MIHEYAAIDPMALLFPSRLYMSMSEKLHPHVPKSVEIKEAVGRLTPEERHLHPAARPHAVELQQGGRGSGRRA